MLSQEQHHQNEVVDTTKDVEFEGNDDNVTIIQSQQLPTGQLTPSPVAPSIQMHLQSLPKSFTESPQLSQRSPQTLTTSKVNPLEGCSNQENYKQPSTQPSKNEPHSQLPPRSLQTQLMSIAMDDPQEGCSHRCETDDNSDCDIDNNTDTRDDKYTKLLDKYRKQSTTLSNLRKKYDSLKHNFAEMKDVIVYATAEAKKAKTDPNANKVSIYYYFLCSCSYTCLVPDIFIGSGCEHHS